MYLVQVVRGFCRWSGTGELDRRVEGLRFAPIATLRNLRLLTQVARRYAK